MSPPNEPDEAWFVDLLQGRCDPIVGLSEAEVDEVAADQGVSLPAAYRAFLSVAGRECGDLWEGSDAFYPAVLGLRNAAVEILAGDEQGVELVPTDVVFAMHEGYEFLFMSGGGPDPAVLRYTEGSGATVALAPRFTQFVSDLVAE